MNWKCWTGAALFLCLPFPAAAQDSRSQAMAGAGVGVPMGPFGIYWNPAVLAIPAGEGSSWAVGSGFSASDTSNTNTPVLRFTSLAASQSPADPVSRSQQVQGLFAVQFQSWGGGIHFDQGLNLVSSQGALHFFQDRDGGSLGASPYALGYAETYQQFGTVILSYASPFPLGSFPFLSVGGSLKYHDGLAYRQTVLTGTFQQGSSTGYQYTKTTSSTGYGLSFDTGLFAKVTDAFQVGVLLQNVNSSFTWTAQQSTLTLDPTTGHETVTATQNLNLSAPFPYATKVSVAAAPADKNILLAVEADFLSGQTNWRFGLERYYPEANLVARLGTFFDNVSSSQLWTFGAGYQGPVLAADISFFTRSLPAIQDSIAVGGALDVAVRF